MKRFTLLTLSFLATLSLAACITIVDDGDNTDSDFDTATDVSVSSDFNEVAEENVLGPGETKFYRVNLSEEVAANNDLVIVEADPESGDALRVTAYNADGEALLASISSDYFGAETINSSELSVQQTVTPTAACNGPCVAVRTPDEAGQAYFSVENSGGTESYKLYVVAIPFTDETEPNDDIREAPLVDQTQLAAIEYVGDEDFFQSANETERVSLTTDSPQLELTFDVYTESGRYLGSGSANEPYILPADQPLQRLIASVTSQNNRAAVGGSANYGISFE